jgi:hypothetical protein
VPPESLRCEIEIETTDGCTGRREQAAEFHNRSRRSDTADRADEGDTCPTHNAPNAMGWKKETDTYASNRLREWIRHRPRSEHRPDVHVRTAGDNDGQNSPMGD